MTWFCSGYVSGLSKAQFSTVSIGEREKVTKYGSIRWRPFKAFWSRCIFFALGPHHFAFSLFICSCVSCFWSSLFLLSMSLLLKLSFYLQPTCSSEVNAHFSTKSLPVCHAPTYVASDHVLFQDTISICVWGTLLACPTNNLIKLEKWFPLQGERGHSSYFWSFQKQNREEGVTEQNEQAYQFTQGYNILHRLQEHHLTLTFIIHNKYIIYIHTYIYELL